MILSLSLSSLVALSIYSLSSLVASGSLSLYFLASSRLPNALVAAFIAVSLSLSDTGEMFLSESVSLVFVIASYTLSTFSVLVSLLLNMDGTFTAGFAILIEEGLAAIAAPILTSVPDEGLWAAADCAEDVFDTAFNNDAASVFLVSIVSAR